ncbi:MAG: hypothetical protein MJZ16_11775 [Bacteroidales bacterium]|nr:hypothetical protein [Bacteroidales bacterium]
MCPPPCRPRRSPRRSRVSEPANKYAAKFKVGYLEITVAAKTLSGLIDQLWQSQDLSCLSRQAGYMGDDNDAKLVEKLDRFLEKYYSGSLKSRDIKNFHYDFSIGSLDCLEFAYGKDEVEALMAKK